MRAALRWLLERGDGTAGARLMVAAGVFWYRRNHLDEARQWLASLLVLPALAERTVLRARALQRAARFAEMQLDRGASSALAEEGLAISRELGDPEGIGQGLRFAGNRASERGDLEGARALYEEALATARAAGDRFATGMTLSRLGMLHNELGDLPAARACAEEGLALARSIGHPHAIGACLAGLRRVTLNQGDDAATRACLEEAIAIGRALGHGAALAAEIAALGELELELEDLAAARARFREALGVVGEMGWRGWGIAYTLDGAAGLAAAEGQAERALRLAGAAARLRELGDSRQERDAAARLERRLAPARRALPPERQAAAVERGRAMTREEAIADALAEAVPS